MPDLTAKITIGAALGRTFGRVFESAERRTTRLGQTLKRAELGAAAAGKVAGLRRELTELQRRQKTVGDSTGVLGGRMREVRRQIVASAAEARQYGIRLGDAARQQRRFAEEARRAAQELGRLERRQQRRATRQQLHGRALPLLGAGYAAARAFGGGLGLEDAQVRLGTVMDSAALGRSLAESRRRAMEFARRNLGTETELLEIEYALNSASLGEQLSRAGSQVVSRLATVTRGAPELVGEVVATTFRNLGSGLEGSAEERFNRVADLLAKTQFKFQIRDFGQLGESMKMAAPELAKYNIELDQGVTLIGALNSAGLQGSMAGTALGATLRRMTRAAKEFGFEIARDSDGALDFIGTLENLQAALGGSIDQLSPEQMEQFDRAFEAEGSRAAVLLLKQLESLRAAQKDVAEGSAGIVSESYQRFLDSTPGKLKIFGNNVRLLGVTVTGALLPGLNALTGALTPLAAGVGGLAERFPGVTAAVGGTAAGVGVLTAALWFGRYAATLVGDAWDAGRGALSALGEAVKWVRARLIAWNATALVTAARAKALAVGGAISTFARSLVAMAATAIPLAVGGLKVLTGAIVANTAAALANPWVLLGVAIAGAAVAIWKYWGPIKEFFSTIWPPIKAALGKVWTWMKEAGIGLISALAEGIAAAPGQVYAALKAVLGPVGRLLPSSDAREGPLAGLTRSGRSLVGALGEGVRQAGPGPLRRPLAATLAGAGLALAAPAASPVAESSKSIVINNYYRIVISQRPGEDARGLAERVIQEIEERQSERRRGDLFDEAE